VKSKLVGVVLAAWIVLEIVCFALVVRALGLLGAMAIALGSSLLGLSDVKRLLPFVRDRVAAKAKGVNAVNAKGDGAVLDTGLQALASILLILPGFASDFVGLALKSPSVRQSLARRLRARSKRADPRVIDLDPDEWRREARSARSRPRRSGAK